MAQPPLSDKPLMVVVNPFSAPLDAHGRPSGSVMFDPEHSGGGAPRYIGMEIHRGLLEKRPAKARVVIDAGPDGLEFEIKNPQQSRYETTFYYDLTPVAVVDSAYHRRALVNGELLAADESTAKRAAAMAEPMNVKFKYVPHEQALAASRAEAIKAAPEPPDESKWVDAGTEKDPRVPLLANWPGAKKASEKKTTSETPPAGGKS